MYTFIKEDNHESKNAYINENVAYDQLNYEDYENELFKRSCMRHAMNIVQSKNQIVVS